MKDPDKLLASAPLQQQHMTCLTFIYRVDDGKYVVCVCVHWVDA